jgi:UDP-glucose 4-epimerase
MKVVVTGGLGFVGSNLVQAMNRAGGYRPVLFDDQSLGKPAFVADLRAEIVRGDIRDAAALGAVLEGADAVVHLAADTRVIPSIADPAFNLDVNVVGSFTLLEAMRARSIVRLVSASTGGAIIGEATPPVHEDMPPAPLSPYGASKLAVEGYCSAYAASYGMRCSSLRFSNVYGPRSFHKGSVVATFLRAILNGRPLEVYGDGSQTRDYVYAGDLCVGILAALERGATGPLQLGTGVPTSINGLIAALREVTGRPFEVIHHPARPGEVLHTHCRIDRARAAIGYDPRTPLEEGLAATWAWFLDHADRFRG